MDRVQSERQYLLALIAEKKKAEARLAGLEKEVELWRSRLQLAKDNGREDLIRAAEGKLAELELELPTLKGSIAVQERDITAARSGLKDAEIDDSRGMSRAQTDALVNQLQTAAGMQEDDPLDFDAAKRREERELKKEISDLEGDLELDALRKKISGEDTPD